MMDQGDESGSISQDEFGSGDGEISNLRSELEKLRLGCCGHLHRNRRGFRCFGSSVPR